MINDLDNLKIISEIKENGYSIIENFYDKNDLDFLKETFVQSSTSIYDGSMFAQVSKFFLNKCFIT